MFTIDKETRLATAQESLESALKIVSRFSATALPAAEMSRLLDAAAQATQAAQQLHQLAGLLQAEVSLSRQAK